MKYFVNGPKKSGSLESLCHGKQPDPRLGDRDKQPNLSGVTFKDC